MRYIPLFVLSIGLLLGLSACGGDDTKSPEQAPRTSREAKSGTVYDDPKPVPDVDMTTLDGKTINLADQTGKVVLVNFWATWCAPCRKEIPDLIDLYSEYQSDGLLIVGIATDQDGRSVVAPFVEKESINYPIVTDTSKTLQSKFDSMYGLPTTYVVSPQGEVVRRILGLFPTEEMTPKLEDMLQEASGT